MLLLMVVGAPFLSASEAMDVLLQLAKSKCFQLSNPCVEGGNPLEVSLNGSSAIVSYDRDLSAEEKKACKATKGRVSIYCEVSGAGTVFDVIDKRSAWSIVDDVARTSKSWSQYGTAESLLLAVWISAPGRLDYLRNLKN